MDSGGPRKQWAQIPDAKGQLLGERTCPMTICRELCKMAKPINLTFELCTWVSRRKHKFDRIRQVVPMWSHGRAHWRHLAKMTEPSVCGSNAALCQITMTICYYYLTICYYYFHSFTKCLSVEILQIAGTDVL